MHSSTLTTLALALSASLVSAAPAPAEAAPVAFFNVKNFITVCTGKGSQHDCATSFSVSYQNSQEYYCSIDVKDTDYVYCDTPGPEASIAAYIEKGAKHGHPERTLKLRYQLAFPGSEPQNTYGSKVLNKHQKTDFKVVADTE